ncbi:MAG: N-acetylmuramoyl-L-alanine amidase [Chromatiales bacterium]|jgi:N-acetylmuramoyl-L-alanine amidase
MKNALGLVLLLLGLPAWGAQVSVEGVRFWVAPDYTRLVFDTSGPVEHSIFGLSDPERLVIDVKSARLASEIPASGTDGPRIKRIRSGVRAGSDLRLVLDLDRPVKPKSFLLRPNRKYGHRLVIDVYDRDQEASAQPVKTLEPAGERDVVVAVDAGHGGEDPGALGRRGTREKDVTLAIARRLAALIDREPGMRAVMVRKGDYYVGLRQRIEIARKERADLFISIHADAFRDARVQGASVYTLSRRGASSEAARWLAERENSADLIGGVSLEDKDHILASVLLDLSQTAALQASTDVAERVFRRLKQVGRVHNDRVQEAGFVVLKSPDIPSILVETAFISNRTEESRLTDPEHQARLAEAILEGVREYFDYSPPPGTRLAQVADRRHIISRGDTLSAIASQYEVSLSHLREANGLTTDRIRVGQVLLIPGS